MANIEILAMLIIERSKIFAMFLYVL